MIQTGRCLLDVEKVPLDAEERLELEIQRSEIHLHNIAMAEGRLHGELLATQRRKEASERKLEGLRARTANQ